MTWCDAFDRRFYPDDGNNWDVNRFRDRVAIHAATSRRLLDLGAGRGFRRELDYRDCGAVVVGVDPDPVVLTNPLLDEAAVIEDRRLPFDDETFDLVVSCDVLEHVADPELWFKETYRVLRPGGRFLIKTPNRNHYVSIIARWTPDWFHHYVNRLRGLLPRDSFPTLYRCNTLTAIARQATNVGFEIETLESWEGRPEYLRFNRVTYLAGLCWERAVNHLNVLRGLRAVLFATLVKSPETLRPSSVGRDLERHTLP